MTSLSILSWPEDREDGERGTERKRGSNHRARESFKNQALGALGQSLVLLLCSFYAVTDCQEGELLLRVQGRFHGKL